MNRSKKPWLVVETSYDPRAGKTEERIVSRHATSGKADRSKCGRRQFVRMCEPGE